MLPGTACNSELSLTLSVEREFVFFTSAAENLDADRGAWAALILPPSGTAEEKDARFYEHGVIFFHKSGIRNFGYFGLQKGDAVIFELKETPKGKQAIKLQPLK